MPNTQTISALRRDLWRKTLYADVAKEIYFEKLIDRSNVRSIGLRDETSPRGVIQEITDQTADSPESPFSKAIKVLSDLVKVYSFIFSKVIIIQEISFREFDRQNYRV